ncbi:uncharacterized protein [Manis javanica]|uniref:uncharacterized protein n=1 Tax=Manis javanica TaxID=9974 RepID=UPI003C6D46FC
MLCSTAPKSARPPPRPALLTEHSAGQLSSIWRLAGDADALPHPGLLNQKFWARARVPCALRSLQMTEPCWRLRATPWSSGPSGAWATSRPAPTGPHAHVLSAQGQIPPALRPPRGPCPARPPRTWPLRVPTLSGALLLFLLPGPPLQPRRLGTRRHPSHAGTHCCSARPSVRPSWVSRQRPAPRTARHSLGSRRAQWAQYRGLGLTHSKCHLCAQPANLWPKKQYYSFYLFRATQKMALQSKLSPDPESCSHLGAYKPCTPPNSTDSLILKPASPAPPVGALRFLVSMPGRLFPQNGDRLRLSSGLSSAITTPDPPGHPSAPFSFILHCLQGSSI